MKKILRVLILMVIFVIAVAGFVFLTRNRNEDMTIEMGNATLPMVSFEVGGYEVNLANGYLDEMHIPAMRNHITPLDSEGKLHIRIHSFEYTIKEITVEVYTMDGNAILFKQKLRIEEDKGQIELAEEIAEIREAMVKIVIETAEDVPVNYYTRIVKNEELNMKKSIEFAKDFHEKTFEKINDSEIRQYLETDAAKDIKKIGTVTIYSEIEDVMWRDMKAKREGEISWEIKEANPAYTSLKLNYIVTTAEEGSRFFVEEFMRVSSGAENNYLFSYHRTMQQEFLQETEMITKKGIDYGISKEPQYAYTANREITDITFVQNQELWVYNYKTGDLKNLFSFKRAEKEDVRHMNDNHEIRILSIDEVGNVNFAVYGYMNRGTYEGRVGIALYRFDREIGTVEERAFIPSNIPYEVMKYEYTDTLYCDAGENILYLMSSGTLYKINLDNQESEKLTEDLVKEQYVSSENGSILAYQVENEEAGIQVMNFETGESYFITENAGESLRALGFIGNDLVYGTQRESDRGKNSIGEEIRPMYKVDIINEEQKIEKTYQVEGILVERAVIDKEMIVLHRIRRGDAGYITESEDYITGNIVEEENEIFVEQYRGNFYERRIRIVRARGFSELPSKVTIPKAVLYEGPQIIEMPKQEENGYYYVYAIGDMLGKYEQAGTAIQKAKEYSGVVISEGEYIWESGNRNLWKNIVEITAFTPRQGESTLAACIRHIFEYEGIEADAMAKMAEGKSVETILEEGIGMKAVSLNGCSAEDVLYLISKGAPVIAMINESEAVLLTGYDGSLITYVNPVDGRKPSIARRVMNEMLETGGNIMYGYIRE